MPASYLLVGIIGAASASNANTQLHACHAEKHCVQHCPSQLLTCYCCCCYMRCTGYWAYGADVNAFLLFANTQPAWLVVSAEIAAVLQLQLVTQVKRETAGSSWQ